MIKKIFFLLSILFVLLTSGLVVYDGTCKNLENDGIVKKSFGYLNYIFGKRSDGKYGYSIYYGDDYLYSRYEDNYDSQVNFVIFVDGIKKDYVISSIKRTNGMNNLTTLGITGSINNLSSSYSEYLNHSNPVVKIAFHSGALYIFHIDGNNERFFWASKLCLDDSCNDNTYRSSDKCGTYENPGLIINGECKTLTSIYTVPIGSTVYLTYTPPILNIVSETSSGTDVGFLLDGAIPLSPAIQYLPISNQIYSKGVGLYSSYINVPYNNGTHIYKAEKPISYNHSDRFILYQNDYNDYGPIAFNSYIFKGSIFYDFSGGYLYDYYYSGSQLCRDLYNLNSSSSDDSEYSYIDVDGYDSILSGSDSTPGGLAIPDYGVGVEYNANIGEPISFCPFNGTGSISLTIGTPRINLGIFAIPSIGIDIGSRFGCGLNGLNYIENSMITGYNINHYSDGGLSLSVTGSNPSSISSFTSFYGIFIVVYTFFVYSLVSYLISNKNKDE